MYGWFWCTSRFVGASSHCQYASRRHARNADTSVRLPKWLIPAANATPARSSSGGSVATRGILYKGAPFPLRTLPVYYIWYGSWNDSAAMDILTNLASNIGACFKLDTCTADASLCRLASPRWHVRVGVWPRRLVARVQCTAIHIYARSMRASLVILCHRRRSLRYYNSPKWPFAVRRPEASEGSFPHCLCPPHLLCLVSLAQGRLGTTLLQRTTIAQVGTCPTASCTRAAPSLAMHMAPSLPILTSKPSCSMPLTTVRSRPMRMPFTLC